MGSDRKSKKRRSPTNSISEEEEGRSKNHRSSSSSSKRDKKDKVKTKHKHSKHSEKGKKSEEKRDVYDRKRHKRHSDPVEEISCDDYFSKNNEFATWLKEERGLYFSDLSSEAARELFLSFIKDWNNRKLESRYYEGIATAPRTAHNWKITHVK